MSEVLFTLSVADTLELVAYGDARGVTLRATQAFSKDALITYYSGLIGFPTEEPLSPAHTIRPPKTCGTLYGLYRIDGNPQCVSANSSEWGAFINSPSDPFDWTQPKTRGNARFEWDIPAFEAKVKRLLRGSDSDRRCPNVVRVTATRDIQPGEEILIPYRQNRAQMTFVTKKRIKHRKDAKK